jgi:tRNA 2-thiouridine synthesizing protein A
VTGPQVSKTVDCLGRPCPVPVIELARALPTVGIGEVLEVLSDDPAAAVDVPAWCRMRAQEWLGVDGTSHLVRRLH